MATMQSYKQSYARDVYYPNIKVGFVYPKQLDPAIYAFYEAELPIPMSLNPMGIVAGQGDDTIVFAVNTNFDKFMT